MLTRILLDPAAEAAGSGAMLTTLTDTPVTPPAPPATPPPAKEPPPSSVKIELSADEFRLLHEAKTRLAQIESENKRALEAKEADRLKTMAEKGEIQKALDTLREAKDSELKAARDERDRLESEMLTDHKDTIISAALMKGQYADADAAGQVRTLLEGRFECVRDTSGAKVVREKTTLRPADAVIAEWLASNQAKRFLAASSVGGAGGGGQATSPTPGQPTEFDKMPFDQKLVAMLKERQAQAPNGANPYGFGVHNYPTK